MSHKRLDVFMALDLEMNQPSDKIIQVGAVCGNIRTGEVFERLSIFVNPHENLREDIVKLTGIQQEDVDNAGTLVEAYEKLKAMQIKHDAWINCVTWGGGDTQLLLKQLKEENPGFEGWCFGRRWIDVKTLYVAMRIVRGEPIQGGLKNACKKLGVTFTGPAHRADMDALNTFRAYCKMLDFFGRYED